MKTARWTVIFSLALILSIRAGAIDRSELAPLPLPDLSTMEDATRRRLEALQQRVSALQAAGSDDDLGEAYGTLGTYYIAHHLNDAAEVAFVNAERLEPGDFRWPYYLGFVYQMVGKLELEKVVAETLAKANEETKKKLSDAATRAKKDKERVIFGYSKPYKPKIIANLYEVYLCRLAVAGG